MCLGRSRMVLGVPLDPINKYLFIRKSSFVYHVFSLPIELPIDCGVGLLGLVPVRGPTEAPTESPTQAPTELPTEGPRDQPTEAPTESPPSSYETAKGNNRAY